MKKPAIGGQAVLEGVMMRSPASQEMAVCVRKGDGSLAMIRRKAALPKGWAAWPFIRGVVNFIRMMILGVETLTQSAELLGEEYEEEPSKFDKWLSRVTGQDVMKLMTGFAVVMALALAIGLFYVLPNLAVSFLSRVIASAFLINLLEGAVRILILIGYILLVSRMKEMRRTFAYHGAEHKVVNCFEADLPLTVENARGMSTRNPRCGTSFLLIVMILSILVFTLTGWSGAWWTRILVRLALLPLVASLSYETLMFLFRHDNPFFRLLRAPGMALQGLTTREPDDSMLEVSLAAFVAVLTPEERKAWVADDYRLPDEPAPAPAVMTEPSDEVL